MTDADVIEQLRTEGLIDSRTAAAVTGVHHETVVSRIRRGRRGVKLEGFFESNRWWTSRQALNRFAAAMTQIRSEEPPLPMTPTARQKQAEREVAECRRLLGRG